MDRKSCRARKSVASIAAVLGLATAFALAVPTTASAAAHHDRNCGNFDHSDPVFGGSRDGHNRHRPNGFALAAEPRQDRDGDRDDDDRWAADPRDGDGDPGFADERRRDGDPREDGRFERRDDGQDDRADLSREPRFRDREISRDEGGNRNCNNFDHQGKQMHIPPGLFDDDGPR